jgi:hypothetical protein
MEEGIVILIHLAHTTEVGPVTAGKGCHVFIFQYSDLFQITSYQPYHVDQEKHQHSKEEKLSQA